MRRAGVLKRWRLWAVVGLLGYVAFFVAFSLSKILARSGSRWDISWTAVALWAAGVVFVVSLWTFLDRGTKP